MAEHDVHELVGPVVACVVLHVLALAEIPGLAAVERGHDVPGDAALEHQIHRREYTRDMEWLVVGRRVGRPEPQSLRRHSHRHDDGTGIELYRPRSPPIASAWSPVYMSGSARRSSKKANWILPCSSVRAMR